LHFVGEEDKTHIDSWPYAYNFRGLSLRLIVKEFERGRKSIESKYFRRHHEASCNKISDKVEVMVMEDCGITFPLLAHEQKITVGTLITLFTKNY
jgi:hypothetical protein